MEAQRGPVGIRSIRFVGNGQKAFCTNGKGQVCHPHLKVSCGMRQSPCHEGIHNSSHQRVGVGYHDSRLHCDGLGDAAAVGAGGALLPCIYRINPLGWRVEWPEDIIKKHLAPPGKTVRASLASIIKSTDTATFLGATAKTPSWVIGCKPEEAIGCTKKERH